jgi:isoquinoline 1-oxidoreductase beta subunit
MLISAAAATWNVEIASCHAAKGAVIHAPSGRKLTYGRLVDQAAKLPVPNDVVLKDRKDFTLIGTSAKRTDATGKVNGTADRHRRKDPGHEDRDGLSVPAHRWQARKRR